MVMKPNYSSLISATLKKRRDIFDCPKNIHSIDAEQNRQPNLRRIPTIIGQQVKQLYPKFFLLFLTSTQCLRTIDIPLSFNRRSLAYSNLYRLNTFLVGSITIIAIKQAYES